MVSIKCHCRLKTHRFRHIFHCPQYSDLSDKKSLTCETVPLSVKPLELDDASHQKKHRIRRDILLEEVLRQAGIPLLRDRDSESLVRKVVEFLKYREAGAEEKSISVMKSTTKHSEHKEKENDYRRRSET